MLPSKGRFVLGVGLAIALAGVAMAQAPRIEKVEPPNWWLGLPSPMLLLSGENLFGAQVTSRTAGVRVLKTEDGLAGKYLFVDLQLEPSAAPGDAVLSVKTKTGTADVHLPLARRSAAGLKHLPGTSAGFDGFGAADVFYLIMPDRFADGDPSNDKGSNPVTYDRHAARAYHGGDLLGIRQHLPYLKDLGVTTLWLNPVYNNDDNSPNDYHGYGATDFYSVDEHLGKLEDFRELVQAAHQAGIKVVLDIVVNHCGPKHPWNTDPPSERWFHGSRGRHMDAHSPFESLIDEHAPPRDWRDLNEGWFAGVLPDFNTEDARVARYMRQNAYWWAETAGLDGFRLDTFPYVGRRFWHDFHAELGKTYPRMMSIGEVFHTSPTVTAYFAGGRTVAGEDTGVATLFDFPLFSALRDVTIREAPATRLVEVLRLDWMYPHPEQLITFLGNHDTKRFVTEVGSGGNVSDDKLMLAMSLLGTLRGIPQFYSGDEIAMPGGDDPDNRRDFPGGFPGDAQNAFTAAGRTAEQERVFSHLRSVLALRKAHPALQDGSQTHIFADDAVYAFVRESAAKPAALGAGQKAEHLLVVVNTRVQARTLSLDVIDTPLETAEQMRALFGPGAGTVRQGKVEVEAPPRSVTVFDVSCGCDL